MRVAICAGGFGAKRVFSQRLSNKDWELWGVNATWTQWHNAEHDFQRWFELHRLSYLTWEHGDPSEHLRWLRSLRTLPLYVQTLKDWPDLKTARLYPFKRVAALAPDFEKYHACSIDWMIALAIAEGAKEIALFGVEQDHTSEPWGSRACVEFWSGIAIGRGIKVWSIEGSTFKLAQLVYSEKPYAMDPTWLTKRDETAPDSMLSLGTAQLKRIVNE